MNESALAERLAYSHYQQLSLLFISLAVGAVVLLELTANPIWWVFGIIAWVGSGLSLTYSLSATRASMSRLWQIVPGVTPIRTPREVIERD